MTTLYTIGYELTDIARFVSTLSSQRIELLADVRALAISRKKGFSKNSLRNSLLDAGIDYRHFVDLGDPKDGRVAARLGKFDQFHRIYSCHLASRPAQRALLELAEVAKKFRTCLMCFERDPATCHRTIVAQELSHHGIMISNLFSDSNLQNVRIGKKLLRSNFDQGCSARQQEVR